MGRGTGFKHKDGAKGAFGIGVRAAVASVKGTVQQGPLQRARDGSAERRSGAGEAPCTHVQGATSESGPDTALVMCCGQAGCWTDGDASEAARCLSDFLVGAPWVATRVSEIQYQCEGGQLRDHLVPSASSVSNEVKSLCF